TTENPSFEVIAALLSRARVFVLEPLSEKDLMKLIDSAVKDIERGLGKLKIRLEADAAAFLCRFADGDARFCLNSLEDAVAAANMDSEGCLAVDIKTVKESAEKKSLRYDNNGEEHYNLISAMHKSVRGSDVQASLYWFYRMIESGEDPLYIGRRLVRMATEDIGTADPVALQVSLSGLEAYRILGAPEGVLALAEAVVYNATAPKSNAIYIAEKKLRAEIRSSGYRSVPVHLRNAPTEMMKDLGYGSKYEYDHDFPCSFSGQEYMPDGLEGKLFFRPGSSGYEKEISRRLAFWEDLKHKRNSDS
ncbi:MAG: replication-associated recombination protein A, partial [Fibrobacterota bacterium]